MLEFDAYRNFVYAKAESEMRQSPYRVMRAVLGLYSEINEHKTNLDPDNILSELGDVLFWLVDLNDAIGEDSLTTTVYDKYGYGLTFDGHLDAAIGAAEKFSRTNKIRSTEKKYEDLDVLRVAVSALFVYFLDECDYFGYHISEVYNYNYKKLTGRHDQVTATV
jgi:hypothetical protein